MGPVMRFVYGAAEVKYQAQQKDGTLGPAAATQWSTVKNKATLEVA